MNLSQDPTSFPSIDVSLLTHSVKIREIWAEHFQVVLNQHSDFDTTVVDELRQWPKASHLHKVPSPEEVQRAVSQMSTCKVPGTDGIRSDVIKYGSKELLRHLSDLFTQIWSGESVPQDFKDTLIVHIYKRKGDRAVCDNHRGIHLMSVADKALARVLLNRLRDHGQLCHYTGNPVWLPGGQRCQDNDLLSHTDTREVLREASRSLYGIYLFIQGLQLRQQERSMDNTPQDWPLRQIH